MASDLVMAMSNCAKWTADYMHDGEDSDLEDDWIDYFDNFEAAAKDIMPQGVIDALRIGVENSAWATAHKRVSEMWTLNPFGEIARGNERYEDNVELFEKSFEAIANSG